MEILLFWIGSSGTDVPLFLGSSASGTEGDLPLKRAFFSTSVISCDTDNFEGPLRGDGSAFFIGKVILFIKGDLNEFSGEEEVARGEELLLDELGELGGLTSSASLLLALDFKILKDGMADFWFPPCRVGLAIIGVGSEVVTVAGVVFELEWVFNVVFVTFSEGGVSFGSVVGLLGRVL